MLGREEHGAMNGLVSDPGTTGRGGKECVEVEDVPGATLVHAEAGASVVLGPGKGWVPPSWVGVGLRLGLRSG